MKAAIKVEDIERANDALTDLIKTGRPDPGHFLAYMSQCFADARQAAYEQGMADAGKLEKLGGT